MGKRENEKWQKRQRDTRRHTYFVLVSRPLPFVARAVCPLRGIAAGNCDKLREHAKSVRIKSADRANTRSTRGGGRKKSYRKEAVSVEWIEKKK